MTLGKGGDTSGLLGLHDLQMENRLSQYILGGKESDVAMATSSGAAAELEEKRRSVTWH